MTKVITTVEQNEVEQSSWPTQDENTMPSAPRLSKAWAIESAHVPIYTGGKISTCLLKISEKEVKLIQMNEEDHQVESKTIPCLVVPVSGDVAVIDAERGLKLGSVRSNGENQDSYKINDDDDDDGVDGDAITAFSISQSCLVTCTQNHLIQQYSMDTNVKISGETNIGVSFSLQKSWGKTGHSLPVTLMKFHKTGIFLATGSVDGSVRIWDVRGGHVTHVYRPLAGGSGGGSGRLSVTCIQWLDDTRNLVIAIGRDDGSIAVHDLRDHDMKHGVVLRDHMSAITCMEWWWKQDKESPGSYPAMFVTAGRDAVLNMWQIQATGQALHRKNAKKPKKKQGTQTPKEAEFAVLKAPTYERKQTLPLYEQIEGMVLPRNLGDKCTLVVATAGSRGIVRTWKSMEAEDGQMSALTLSEEEPLEQAYGEARGGYLGLYLMEKKTDDIEADHGDSVAKQQLLVADAEHSLSFLTFADTDETNLTTTRTLVGYNDEILDLKIIPSFGRAAKSNQIVVATNSAQVRIFGLDSFSCHVLDQHTATVLCVDVSPCGRYIATSGKDKRMLLWHCVSRKCIAVAVGHTEAVGATALSKKANRYDVRGKTARNGAGSFVVTASLDRTLKRWNLPGHADLEEQASGEGGEITLDSFASARAHEKDINVVSVAPNDSLVATGSQDKTAKLWNSADLSIVATLKGHRRGVWDCQFSPFDRVLATASGDRSIRLWSLSDYSCVRTFQGHVASVLRVRFLNGGLQLASSGADGLVKIWTIRTNECETTMDGHSDKVWALDVDPVGTTIISGCADSQLLVWKDTTEEAEDQMRAQREEAILMDQQLANHLRHKEFSQALDIALKLDKPRLTLKVLSSIIEADVKEKHSPISSLRQCIPTWSIERVAQVLQYCREWNTRARNSDVAMFVIRAVVSVMPAEDLAAADGVPEILGGVTPYAERHFDRLDRLVASSYLFDFALFSAGSIEGAPEDDFTMWEAKSKLVLPPAFVEGKTQLGGKAIVGGRTPPTENIGSDGEVSVVGDSDSSDDERVDKMHVKDEDADDSSRQSSMDSATVNQAQSETEESSDS